jgi:hypothetical protein
MAIWRVEQQIEQLKSTDGTLKRTLTDDYISVISLTVLSNGDIASALYNMIKIWNSNDGTLKKTLRGNTLMYGFTALTTLQININFILK